MTIVYNSCHPFYISSDSRCLVVGSIKCLKKAPRNPAVAAKRQNCIEWSNGRCSLVMQHHCHFVSLNHAHSLSFPPQSRIERFSTKKQHTRSTSGDSRLPLTQLSRENSLTDKWGGENKEQKYAMLFRHGVRVCVDVSFCNRKKYQIQVCSYSFRFRSFAKYILISAFPI